MTQKEQWLYGTHLHGENGNKNLKKYSPYSNRSLWIVFFSPYSHLPAKSLQGTCSVKFLLLFDVINFGVFMLSHSAFFGSIYSSRFFAAIYNMFAEY